MGLLDFMKPKRSSDALLIDMIDHNADHIAKNEGKTGYEVYSWSQFDRANSICQPDSGRNLLRSANRVCRHDGWFDISQDELEQFSQAFRLQSSFDGPFDFSAGVNYTQFETLVDYYVMFNVLTALARSGGVPSYEQRTVESHCLSRW